MRILAAAFTVFVAIFITTPAFATEPQKPESIVEKMSFKLVRGLTNVVTSVGEIPKQTYLSVHNHGAVGYVVGPIKGIGMTVYRALIGGAEAVTFLVPAPGYYDPMLDPPYVWQGWDTYRTTPANSDGTAANNPARNSQVEPPSPNWSWSNKNSDNNGSNAGTNPPASLPDRGNDNSNSQDNGSESGQ